MRQGGQRCRTCARASSLADTRFLQILVDYGFSLVVVLSFPAALFVIRNCDCIMFDLSQYRSSSLSCCESSRVTESDSRGRTLGEWQVPARFRFCEALVPFVASHPDDRGSKEEQSRYSAHRKGAPPCVATYSPSPSHSKRQQANRTICNFWTDD